MKLIILESIISPGSIILKLLISKLRNEMETRFLANNLSRELHNFHYWQTLDRFHSATPDERWTRFSFTINRFLVKLAYYIICVRVERGEVEIEENWRKRKKIYMYIHIRRKKIKKKQKNEKKNKICVHSIFLGHEFFINVVGPLYDKKKNYDIVISIQDIYIYM